MRDHSAFLKARSRFFWFSTVTILQYVKSRTPLTMDQPVQNPCYQSRHSMSSRIILLPRSCCDVPTVGSSSLPREVRLQCLSAVLMTWTHQAVSSDRSQTTETKPASSNLSLNKAGDACTFRTHVVGPTRAGELLCDYSHRKRHPVPGIPDPRAGPWLHPIICHAGNAGVPTGRGLLRRTGTSFPPSRLTHDRAEGAYHPVPVCLRASPGSFALQA